MAKAPRNWVLQYVRRIAGMAGADVGDADLLSRFLDRRDEVAFELLLWRHGTMVWQVCRDVARDSHAAEDAFQATFLALVRKSAAIRSRDSLGAWLYQVAYRAALKARRGGRETSGVNLSTAPAELPDESALRELRPIVHEEVQRLPAKYRTPIILCYLEGLTHEEAARELSWPKGTVASRVARARELLRKRLTRRGITLAVTLAALGSVPASASALVPAPLIQTALRAGTLLASGQSPAGVVSPYVIALNEGVLRTMFWTKVKITAAVVCALCLLGGGVGIYAGGFGQSRDESVVASHDNAADGGQKDQADKGNGKIVRRDAKALRQSVSNLKNIALGMHNHHDTYGFFPASAIYGKNGKPLLSWRVALLPFLEQDHLYKQFHLDEPWDSAHNKKLLEKMPDIYRVPGQKDRTGTYYQVFVGEGTVFEQRRVAARGSEGGAIGGAGGTAAPTSKGAGAGENGATAATGSETAGQQGGVPSRGLRIADIVDGTSNTIMIIEGGSTVPWTKPEDLPYSPLGKLPPLGGAFPDCIHAALADGSVQTIKRNFDEQQMRRAITRNDGEVVDMDQLIDPAPGADVETLKKDNDDMRRQIEAAHREVIELTRTLRDVRLKGESRNTGKKKSDEDAELSVLKREHQLMKQELERLESEVRRLKQEIDGGDVSKPTAPGRTKK
jgi:RNA polymerase sigma factor (sigma-70 family)